MNRRGTRTGRWSVAAFALLLAAIGCSHAAALTPIESIRNVRELREVRLSPDGRHVAAVITASTAEGGQRHLWMVTAKASELRQLTRSPDATGIGEYDPEWSADGKALFFLAQRNGIDSIHRLSLTNGSDEELILVSDATGKMTAHWQMANRRPSDIRPRRYAVSPDGRWIALIGIFLKPPVSAAATKRQDDAIEVGKRKSQPAHLFLLELATMQVREVSLADEPQSLSWNPDSRRLSVVTALPGDDDFGTRTQAWRVAVASGAVSRFQDIPQTVRTVAWTHDGLAYLARCQDDAPPECMELFAYDTATHKSLGLTRGMDGSLVDDLVVDRDGRSVVTPIMVGLEQRLARIELDGSGIHWLVFGEPVVSDVQTNATRNGWLIVAGGPQATNSIYLASRSGGDATRLSIPDTVPANWPAAMSHRIAWTHDGERLEGLLYLPQMAGARRVPLVAWVHGGPYGAFQDRYYRLVNLLVGQGWSVLLTNPRGSMGRGATFAAANRNDLGGEDFADIMAGVDAAIGKFPIDPQRLALVGFSYGGTMAAFVEGRTDRFKALVAGAPVIDQFSEYGTEDSSYDDRWYFGFPWTHPAAVWRQSPLARVAFARTPMLLLQGAADPVDPPAQSGEWRRALLQVGVPVQLVIYPRETHASLAQAFGMGPSREPWHGVDLAERMIGFVRSAFGKGRGGS